MQRKAGTPRVRHKGAAKPSARSLAMRLTSILPQIAQCATSKCANGVLRERKRLEHREHRQGTLPTTRAKQSRRVRLRDLRHSAELQTVQTMRDLRHLSWKRASAMLW